MVMMEAPKLAENNIKPLIYKKKLLVKPL